MSSSLTKEQLKSVLINHGITTPPSSAKKEEFQKLYDEHVAPVLATKGEFSSDDEPDTSALNEPAVNKLQNGGNLSSGVLNGTADTSEGSLGSMSDDELFSRLKDAGINCGPITSTTRGFYQKKLSQVLKGDGSTPTPSASAAVQSAPVNDEEYSDNDDVDIVVKNQEESDISLVDDLGASASPIAPQPQEDFTNLRQRQRTRTEDAAVGHLLPPGRGPTPRPTIREARGDLSKEYAPLSFPSFESPQKVVKCYAEESLKASETKTEKRSRLTRRNILLALAVLLISVLVAVVLMCPETIERVRDVAVDLYNRMPTLKAQSGTSDPVAEQGQSN